MIFVGQICGKVIQNKPSGKINFVLSFLRLDYIELVVFFESNQNYR